MYDILHAAPSTGIAGQMELGIQNKLVKGIQRIFQAVMVALLSNSGPIDTEQESFLYVLRNYRALDKNIVNSKITLAIDEILANVNDDNRDLSERVVSLTVIDLASIGPDAVSIRMGISLADGVTLTYEYPIQL